jgi:hypothetical protein
MKILFLDVDGVLNSERSFLAGGPRIRAYEQQNPDDPYYVKITTCTIDPIAVDLVNRVCRELDVQIVVSSTHRQHFPDGPAKLMQMKAYFEQLGIHGEFIIDWTPKLNTIRGIEIQDWLNRHPEVTHYVILDDSSDMLPEQMEYFVHCDGGLGVSAQNYRDMTRLFGREDSGIILL